MLTLEGGVTTNTIWRSSLVGRTILDPRGTLKAALPSFSKQSPIVERYIGALARQQLKWKCCLGFVICLAKNRASACQRHPYQQPMNLPLQEPAFAEQLSQYPPPPNPKRLNIRCKSTEPPLRPQTGEPAFNGVLTTSPILSPIYTTDSSLLTAHRLQRLFIHASPEVEARSRRPWFQ